MTDTIEGITAELKEALADWVIAVGPGRIILTLDAENSRRPWEELRDAFLISSVGRDDRGITMFALTDNGFSAVCEVNTARNFELSRASLPPINK